MNQTERKWLKMCFILHLKITGLIRAFNKPLGIMNFQQGDFAFIFDNIPFLETEVIPKNLITFLSPVHSHPEKSLLFPLEKAREKNESINSSIV